MKVLIIGGTGLISTEIVQQLLARGDDVTLFNRGRTTARFDDEVRLEKLRFLVGDRQYHTRFESIVRASGPWDVVIDMICQEPQDAQSLVRACRGVTEHLVLCSTTNVYPKPAEAYPVNESHRLEAAFKNGIDKIECERICRWATNDFALTIIRPGHTYGESGLVLHSLGSASSYLDRVRRGKPVIVHGDGNGLWSALHATDVASAFVAATIAPGARGQIYNVAGEEWMTWNQYQERVAAALDVAPPPLVHIPVEALEHLAPERSAQCRRSFQFPGIYDTSRARQELGFCQRISFTSGMRRVVTWLEAHQAIEPWQSDEDYERVLAEWNGIMQHLRK